MENDNNELQHWGIKGMKWGVRRFQNNDGSLTPAGKKRYGFGVGNTFAGPSPKPSKNSMVDGAYPKSKWQKRYEDSHGINGSRPNGTKPFEKTAPSLYSIRKAQRKAQENLKAAPNMIGDKRKQAKLDKYEQHKAEAERLKEERAKIKEEKYIDRVIKRNANWFNNYLGDRNGKNQTSLRGEIMDDWYDNHNIKVIRKHLSKEQKKEYIDNFMKKYQESRIDAWIKDNTKGRQISENGRKYILEHLDEIM